MSLNVVAVGAGVIGAAIAADLARGGATVTVLESGQPAAGTSKTTFAWTNAGGKQPRSYFDLNVEGMQAHRRLAAPAKLVPPIAHVAHGGVQGHGVRVAVGI